VPCRPQTADYRRPLYFYEAVIMLRKLAVVGLLILTSNQDSIIQVRAGGVRGAQPLCGLMWCVLV
jgi:hypothetical protein